MFKLYSASKTLIWPVLIMVFYLMGCSSTSELLSDDPVDKTESIDYSVIYYIHADSDYLFHDAAGEPVRGNRKVLESAHSVAKNAKSGEVFIFYQRPERKFMGLFPRRSSRLYHYTNGKLTGEMKYRHADKSEDFLTTEARLFNHYRNHSREGITQNYLLYFGHEIPEERGAKYHRTLPGIEVNTGSFAAGAQKFLGNDDGRFDLILLSTCNNGTPEMAEHLMDISDLLLASPQNLHLSHIDSESFSMLETDPGITPKQLADSLAEQTYRRLSSEIQTAITLSVYDFETVQLHRNTLHDFTASYQQLGRLNPFSDNVDCKQLPFFDDDVLSKGVKTWYKPARFGRRASTDSHSGWGCRPTIESE